MARSWTPAATGAGAPPVSLVLVPFLQPESAGRPGSSPGSIDYRFARRQLLQRFRSGELSTGDVCDAEIELMRIAVNCSSGSTVPCPVCAGRGVVDDIRAQAAVADFASLSVALQALRRLAVAER